jgi:protein-S-isoprenylcysteine O-methyltransferase Ste14
MKFVDDVKDAWRWFSVQAMALALALQGAWEVLTPEMRTSIPPQYVTWGTLFLLALGIGGRLVKQK